MHDAYPLRTTDFSAILTKVRTANPDVLGGATRFEDAVAITRQMKALNVNPRMYGLTVGVDLRKFYEVVGHDAEFVSREQGQEGLRWRRPRGAGVDTTRPFPNGTEGDPVEAAPLY